MAWWPKQEENVQNQGSPGMQSFPQRRQLQFVIQHRDQDGNTLEGQFTTRRMSIKEVAQVNVRKVQLNGGFYHDPENPGRGVDEDTDFTNHMISHLDIALIQQPMWFNLDTLDDAHLLLKVYEKCIEFENSFNAPQQNAVIGTQPDGSSQADSGGKNKETGAAGRVEAVGGGEVQNSLDP